MRPEVLRRVLPGEGATREKRHIARHSLIRHSLCQDVRHEVTDSNAENGSTAGGMLPHSPSRCLVGTWLLSRHLVNTVCVWRVEWELPP